MQSIALAWHYIAARPLAAALNVLLLALGLASMCFLLLVQHQVQTAFERDLQGIDVVVGAKGSPLQLILAGVFHIDVPSGNVPLQAIKALAANPQVKKLIPLSLGDSVGGFRIVGTTPDYISHYDAKLASGALWRQPMQAVAGHDAAQALAKLGLQPGKTFAGNHGLGASGHAHGETPYTLVGVLAPCGCVLDRLVLTATESVWQVHEKATALDDDDRKALAEAREVTLALIQYASPMSAVSFPRFVNTTTEMQAAAPALEITRLFRMMGVGTDVLRGFAAVLLLIATISLLIALWNALRERQADWAMLRMLGASPARVASVLVWQALILTLAAGLLGLALGHGLAGLVGQQLAADRSLPITGWLWLPQEIWLLGGAVGLALLAALLPVWAAYRLDVLKILQSR
ncbi:MAG: FtsX-like permease family protein [Burkholderiaceae bacterium]